MVFTKAGDGYFAILGNRLAFVSGSQTVFPDEKDGHVALIRDLAVHENFVVTVGDDKQLKKWQFVDRFELLQSRFVPVTEGMQRKSLLEYELHPIKNLSLFPISLAMSSGYRSKVLSIQKNLF